MKMTKLVSASALALLAISASSPVFAAEGTAAPQAAHSTAKVGITEGKNTDPTDPAGPKDPTDPDNPVDPTDPDNPGTGNAGPLSIDYAPNFDFGSKELAAGGDTEFTLADNAQPYAQVTDKRNTGAGWVLSVRLAADAKGATATDMDTVWTSGTEKLKGAILALPKASTDPVATDNQSAAPTGSEIATVNGSSQVITTADKDQGMGSWRSEFDKAGVKLTVPAGNKVGNYTANLTWELTDAAKA